MGTLEIGLLPPLLHSWLQFPCLAWTSHGAEKTLVPHVTAPHSDGAHPGPLPVFSQLRVLAGAGVPEGVGSRRDVPVAFEGKEASTPCLTSCLNLPCSKFLSSLPPAWGLRNISKKGFGHILQTD